MSATLLHAARLLIQRYGEIAEKAAAERAATLMDDGDTVGAATWLHFADAVRHLQGRDVIA